MIRRKRIRQMARELLEEHGVTNPPVPVEEIVHGLGLLIRKQKLVHKRDGKTKEISGFISREGDNVVIGVNSFHAPPRQRFSVSHELAHYFLHAPWGTDTIHIDRVFGVKFRDDLSSQGVDPEEREANLFAAELLMPQHFIERDLEQGGEMDIVDDDFLQELADRYEVSTQAMLFRLANLGYVSL